MSDERWRRLMETEIERLSALLADCVERRHPEDIGMVQVNYGDPWRKGRTWWRFPDEQQ